MRSSWIATVLCVFVAGCVSMRVVRVHPDKPQKTRGFRYYLPEPYLLVHEEPRIREVKVPVLLDGKVLKGAFEESVVHEGRWEIVYLPDREREMAVTPRTFLAGQSLNLKLEDGWKLTEVSGEHQGALAADVLAEVIGILAKSSVDMAGLMAQAQSLPESSQEPKPFPIPPGLYRLKSWENGEVELQRVMISWKIQEEGQGPRTRMETLD